jgi:hypothetical protein
VRPPEARPAAAGLVLVLVVVLASAAIRLNATGIEPLLGASGLAALRGVHRTAASLEVLAALWLAWVAWREAGLILVLTVLLSLLGIVAGRTPTPLQSLGNLLGGLALAAAFARVLGKGKWGLTPGLTPFLLLALFALQALIGGRLSIVSRVELPALPAHALLGLGLAALCGWLALARTGGTLGRGLFLLALAAPITGFTALEHPYSALPALVHAAAVAFFIVTAAFALSRKA